MPPTEPVLRRLTLADAEECAALAKRVQWSHSATAWQQFIRWGGEHALCLRVGDAIVTTGVAVRYSERLAWVGVVITDPAYQGRGFARRLMMVIMDDLLQSGVQSVMLDASEKGYPVYDQLGFRALYRMEVWTGVSVPVVPAPTVRLLREADLDDVVALDAELLGVARPDVVRAIWQQDMAWMDYDGGQVSGYLLAQADHRGIHIGPWYHRSPEGAHDLLRAALNASAGKPLRLQIPDRNAAALAFIQQYGLTCSRFCTRMVYGEEPPGHMAEQYGIVGFATG
jgi:GNAT superfamily N-acetyltransferase